MSRLFPCPNPACSYQFDAGQLPAAAMVTCPLCRTRFPYRAATPAPSPQPSTASSGGDFDFEDEQDAPPPPKRRGRDDGRGRGRDDEPPPRAASAPKGRSVVKVHDQPKKSVMLYVWLAIGALFATAIIVVVAMNVRNNPFRNDLPVSEDVDVKEFNYVFSPKTWVLKKAETMPSIKNARAFIYKHPEKEAFFCLDAVDYNVTEKRNMVEGDLAIMRRKFLGANFNDLQKIAESETKFAGESAKLYEFSGNHEIGSCLGEAYTFSYKGIGYVALFFAEQEVWNNAKAEILEPKERFRLGKHREKWTPMTGGDRTHVVAGKNYEIRDPLGRWEMMKERPAGKKKINSTDFIGDPKEDFGDDAVMALRIDPKQLGNRKDINAKAKAVLFAIKPAGDNDAETARKYIEARVTKPDDPEMEVRKMKKLEKSPTGQTIPQDGATIELFQVESVYADNAEKVFSKELHDRLILVASLRVGDQLCVLEAECSKEDIAVCEELMIKLASGLRERK